MEDHSVAYVALDTSKLRNAVALAESGRGGEIRYLGEIENTAVATAKLVRRLSRKYGKLTFCYEAGPTGYGLYRHITSLGHECLVAAPSLIPRKPGDRVKTNRLDALSLARQLRAGDLTAVWVPDARHEAMRDLTRARQAASEDLRAKRQQVSALLLRLGRVYPGKTSWGKAHASWLAGQKLEHLEQRIALEELMVAVRQTGDRIRRLEQAIGEAVPDWSLAGLVTALMALRGIDFIAATTLLAEIGDLTRFRTPRELMGYLGLVPSERSTGERVWRGGITKTGNRRARRILVESAWSYRHPPRVGKAKLAKLEAAPPAVRDIAWKAQSRLSARYRALTRAGKLDVVAIAAVARELAAFVWAVARAASAPSATPAA
jgi:transposase